MERKPFVVYAASDKRYGDFLIDHWYRSLRDHADLDRTEVRILDYGLSTAQRYYLTHEGAGVVPCVKDGHVAVRRFRDLARDLEARPFHEQVLAADGGDIIFQADLGPLFETAPDQLRAVAEDLSSGFDVFLREDLFDRPTIAEIRRVTALKPQLNAGVLAGPRDRFLALCQEVTARVKKPGVFGPDQLVVNLVLHRDGYFPLPRGSNFVVATAQEPFVIDQGVFRFAATGEPIPVVHNAGNWKFLRPIDHFGYGPGHNRLKPDVLQTLRLLHQSSDLIQTTRHQLRRLAQSAFDRGLAS